MNNSKKTKKIKIRFIRGCRVDGDHFEVNEVKEVNGDLAKLLIATRRAKEDDGKEIPTPVKRDIEDTSAVISENASLKTKLTNTENTVKGLEERIVEVKSALSEQVQRAEEAETALKELEKTKSTQSRSNR